MLKVTLHESDNAVKLVLEGRVVGPWVDELDRAWVDAVPKIGSKKVSIDLRNVTYADAAGRRVLKGIFSHSGAKLEASSLGIQDLANEIARS